jgi:hypothetical protein
MRTSRAAVAVLVTLATIGVGVVASAAPAHAAASMVGLLPAANGVCPSLAPTRYSVYMDNEDDSNANSRGGWIGGIQSTTNTRVFLCAIDGTIFRNLMLNYRVNFAVPALGPTCPIGTIPFDRYHDDEDDSNTSSASVPAGSETRTVGTRGTNFRFCWFLNYDFWLPEATNGLFPPLGGSYGVFGPSALWGLETGFFRTDDEDDSNANSMPSLGPTYDSFRSQWVTATTNTLYRVVRVG